MKTIWLSLEENERPEDKWDSHGVKRILAALDSKNLHVGRAYGHGHFLDDDVDVVVLSAGPNAPHVDAVNQCINELDHLVLVLTADEQGLFPIDRLSHPRMIVWRQTPRIDETADRFLGYPCPDRTLEVLSEVDQHRDVAWCFMGQVTHERRQRAARMMRVMPGGVLIETGGFTQGLQPEQYVNVLQSSKIAVCPAGATTPDTFRVAEALTAGCIPIVDALGPDGEGFGYWEKVYGRNHPLVQIEDWNNLPDVVADVLENWDERRQRCASWWRTYNVDLPELMQNDIARIRRA